MRAPAIAHPNSLANNASACRSCERSSLLPPIILQCGRLDPDVFSLIDALHSAPYAGWQTRLNPGIALVRGLEEALKPKTFEEKVMRGLQQPVKN
jgi:hypothetical protein